MSLSSAEQKAQASFKNRLTNRSGWVLRVPLLPALLLTLLLTQIPFVLTIWYSLQDWSLLSGRPSRFTGIANFKRALSDPIFWKALGITGIITVETTIVCLIIGLAMALLLNHPFKGRGLARTIAITPFFIMPVAATLFWKSAMFDATFGFFAWVSHLLGFSSISWLSNYPLASITILLTWRFAPFAMLILLAGLQAASQEQLEAANIDGAGPISRLRFILLPHLRPFLELSALLLAMNLIQTFGEIAILTAGGPAFATTNITYFVYLQAFNSFDYGYASAIAMIALVMTIALVMPTLRLLTGIFQEGGRR